MSTISTIKNVKFRIAESNISVSWNSLGTGFEYDVEHKADGDWVYQTTNDTSFIVSDLIPDTSYYFRIRGKKEGKEGEWSSVSRRKTLPPFPKENQRFVAPPRREPTDIYHPEEYIYTSDIKSFDLSHPSAVGIKVKWQSNFRGIVLVYNGTENITTEEVGDTLYINVPCKHFTYVNGPTSIEEKHVLIDGVDNKIEGASKKRVFLCNGKPIDPATTTNTINDTITMSSLFWLGAIDQYGLASIKFSHIPVGFGWAYINGIGAFDGSPHTIKTNVQEPANISVEQHDHAIDVSWDNVSNFVKIQRKVNGDSPCEWETIAVVPGKNKKFTDDYIVPGAVYCYSVSSLVGEPVNRACVTVKD